MLAKAAVAGCASQGSGGVRSRAPTKRRLGSYTASLPVLSFTKPDRDAGPDQSQGCRLSSLWEELQRIYGYLESTGQPFFSLQTFSRLAFRAGVFN